MSIGKALAAAREQAGMSVEQVSEATRVRQTLVRQIENDDFSQCGGDFYARGHIRSIAHTIGLDAGPLIAEFDAQRAGGQVARPTQVFEPETVTAERRGPNWSAAMVLALAIVCIWGLVELITPGTSHKSPTLAGSPPAVAITSTPSAPATPSARATSAPPDDTVAAVPRNGVSVRLMATSGNSWVRLTGKGGKQLFEGFLRKGQSQDVFDKETVRAVLGNAGALRLIVNGKDIGSPGETGDVAHLRFSPGDPQDAG